MPFEFFKFVFGPGDVVVEDYPEHKRPLAEAMVDEWRPLQGAFRPRGWVMDKGGHGRTKQLELEGYYGRTPRLQTLKKPGGGVDVWLDSWFRMNLVDLAAEEPPPKIPPKKKRPPRPRTEAELEGLRKGRERMSREAQARRKEADATS
jgi:hypothetical protein